MKTKSIYASENIILLSEFITEQGVFRFEWMDKKGEMQSLSLDIADAHDELKQGGFVFIGNMEEEGYITKRFLCVEHGEEFLLVAKDMDDARHKASLWGAGVIRQLSQAENEKVMKQGYL